MNEQIKATGEVFDVISVNGKTIIYVELPVDSTFKEGDKVEITVVNEDAA